MAEEMDGHGPEKLLRAPHWISSNAEATSAWQIATHMPLSAPTSTNFGAIFTTRGGQSDSLGLLALRVVKSQAACSFGDTDGDARGLPISLVKATKVNERRFFEIILLTTSPAGQILGQVQS